jgi:hypothetical protein
MKQTIDSTVPGGKPTHTVFVYNKVADGNTNDVFVGRWRYDPTKSESDFVYTIEQTESGIVYKISSGTTLTLTSDGQRHPVLPASGSAKLKHMDKDGFEWIRLDNDGKEMMTSRIEVLDQNTLRLTTELKYPNGQISRTESILERR